MGSKTPKATTTTSTTTVPANVSANYDYVSDAAKYFAAKPYSGYSGEGVAGLNGVQQSGIAGIQAANGAGQPYTGQADNTVGQGLNLSQNYISNGLNQANQWISQGSQAPSAADIQAQMSPFTQNVVDATRANLNANDAVQQQGVLGTAIKGGYFGGDRAGIAAADLARQQGLADNQTIAGLYNSGYQTALGQANANANRELQAGTAEGQISNQAGLGLGQLYGQAANTYGSLGTQAFNQAEQGAAATLAAGNQQQSTQQAQDSYNKAMFDAQNQYPFQTTSWLSGILTGMGNQGSSTSTTSPGASTTSQVAGAATAGVGILGATGAFGSTGWLSGLFASDERVKENIEPVGMTFDRQPIYRFNYLDDPRTQIGLIAQDVARAHPSAVGQMGGGVLGVNYDMATRQAADRGGFADGGTPDTAGVAGVSLAGLPTTGWGHETFPGQDQPQGQVTHPDTAGDHVVAGYTIPHSGAAAPTVTQQVLNTALQTNANATGTAQNVGGHDPGNGGGLGGSGFSGGLNNGNGVGGDSTSSWGGGGTSSGPSGDTNWGGIIGGGLGAIGGGLLGGVGGAIAGGVGGYKLGTGIADAQQDAEQDREDNNNGGGWGGGTGGLWQRGGRVGGRNGFASGGTDDDEEDDTPDATATPDIPTPDVPGNPNLPPPPPPIGKAPVAMPAPGVAGAAGQGFKAPPGYYSRTAGAESSGNPTAQNPVSSARGLFQFTTPTWNNTIKRHPELGVDPIKDRDNPDAQRKVMDAFTADNAGLLEARGISPTAANLRSQHFLGASGGVRFIQGYQSDPNAPATKYAAPDQVSANPTVFFNKDGTPKTVAQVYSRFASEATGTGTNEADLPSAGAQETSGKLPSKSDSGLTDQDKWMALTMAGLGIMGGTSPYAAANIGQGAQKGIEYLSSAKQANLNQARADLEAKRLDEEMQQHKIANDARTKQLAISQQQADQTGRYYTSLAKQYEDNNNDPSGNKKLFKDPAMVSYGKAEQEAHNKALQPGETPWTVADGMHEFLRKQQAGKTDVALRKSAEDLAKTDFTNGGKRPDGQRWANVGEAEEFYYQRGLQRQRDAEAAANAARQPAPSFRTDLPMPPTMSTPGGGVAGGAPAPGAGVAPAGRPAPRAVPGASPSPVTSVAPAPGAKVPDAQFQIDPGTGQVFAPKGFEWSPSRKMYRDPATGRTYDQYGRPVQ